MPKKDIFVVGASAGGVEALQKLVSQLPAGFPGSLFVVLHIPPRSKSFLPELLSRAGNLTACHPVNGSRIEPGHIYVAPPDYHLLVEQGHVHLSMGPKEQHHRPCINVLFRSAALAYGERVAGIMLTGELDDGTAGLWEIKRRGGTVIVQNPEEAAFPSMPLSALREIEADYTLGLSDISSLLVQLASDERQEKQIEIEHASMEPQLTDLTCPDCRGTIWVTQKGKGKEFRCRVGHTFSPKSMLSEQFASQEKLLYGAIVSLEEGASLAMLLAKEFDPPLSERLRAEAKERETQAETLRRVLKERSAFSLD